MPIVSAFFGIVVRMYYREHEPPHFHAEHQGQQATFDFSGVMLSGELQSATARRMIRRWAAKHRAALAKNWRAAKVGNPLERIPPLE